MHFNQQQDEESYYEILEVSKDASHEEIKKKRKELSIKYHPDKLPSDKQEWGTNKIQKINEAYNVLSDPEKRKIYDQYGKAGLDGNPGFNQHGFDIHDIFNGFGFMGKSSKAQKIPPIRAPINVTLEEIFNGKTTTCEIERLSLCKKCDGTGFTDKQSHKCNTCQGKKMVFHTIQLGPGMFQKTQMPCHVCKGSGNDLKSSSLCKDCDGESVKKEMYTVTVEIKPGSRNGDAIEIMGQGHELPQEQLKGKRGDVIIIINELPHSVFKRGISFNGHIKPANLLIEVELTLCEGLCGFSKEFKYLDGTTKYIDHYDIIKDGDLKIIRGLGLPYRNKPYSKGDLYVKFSLKYPQDSELSNDQKIKIYEILTKKKYDSSKIHKLPKGIEPVLLSGIDQSGHHGSYYDDDHDDHEGHNHGNVEHVQCAQQ
jgi:DnaJ family protein A protein 2